MSEEGDDVDVRDDAEGGEEDERQGCPRRKRRKMKGRG